MKIAVAGVGYVGLVTAVCLAEVGHHVTCVDIDSQKIKLMESGKSPIYEDELENLMNKNKEKLVYTTDYKAAYKNASIIFVGVGTPERVDGSANLDYVYRVCDNIKESAETDKIVVIKSTVPIGTNDRIEERLNENSKIKFHVVSNPEFLAQGSAVHDTLYPSRIVVGVEDEYSEKMMRQVYHPLMESPYNAPYLTMDRKSAEMVKYASNDFLALKISYINEIANFCEKVGADITEVTKGMSYDSRIGDKFLNAGIGYGGSCFPKDTSAFHWLSKAMDCELKTVAATIEVNKLQRLKLFEKFKSDFQDNIKDKTVAILGCAFKPGTDDLREAPSIYNINLLLNYGVKINVYDPIAEKNMYHIFQNQIHYFSTIDDAIKETDAVFIMTELQEIAAYDIHHYKDFMKTPYVYDGRNCYSLNDAKKSGIYYYSIGRRYVK